MYVHRNVAELQFIKMKKHPSDTEELMCRQFEDDNLRSA